MVGDYSNSDLKEKQYKQKNSTKSSKTEIKFLTSPGLAKLGFEQPRPGDDKVPPDISKTNIKSLYYTLRYT